MVVLIYFILFFKVCFLGPWGWASAGDLVGPDGGFISAGGGQEREGIEGTGREDARGYWAEDREGG